MLLDFWIVYLLSCLNDFFLSIFIRLESMLYSNNGLIYGTKKVFSRSAIAPPKVNRF